MSESGLDTEFYQSAINSSKSVTIFLVNGVRLDGNILKQDDRTLLMTKKDRGETQVVYKHAISSISTNTGRTHG